MSQKYEEYCSSMKDRIGNLYHNPNEEISMIPKKDEELDREIRDRAIIGLVKKATLEGKELSYGDIRLIIDDDPTEKEYENGRLKTK